MTSEADDGFGQLESESLALTVMLPDGPIQAPIPVAGQLLLGRSPECQVQIAHPSISRHHALFRPGEGGLTIEDLGSQNGTFVHGQAVSPGERIHVFANALIHLGTVEVRLRRAHQPRLPARVWPHAYIEGRVEEESARARRKNTTFALLRLAAPDAPAGACEQALDATMRAYDVLGLYSTGVFEVLLIETSPEQAERAASRLSAALKQRGVSARIAVSCFPRDGSDAEEIFGHASNVLCDRPDAQVAAYEGQVAASPSMQSVMATAITVADSRLSVLILGETGVGKEVCAQLIHDRSPRAGGTFLKLHCAALPESLIESELFGHERGAFTGAVSAKAGLIESAAGGTLFLDEIGELSLNTQAKLLRVFDAREVVRIGARQAKTVDVRFVAATNRHLEDEVAAGRFRQDLYFRLAGVVLQIPPLRERVSEIVLLAQRFIDEISKQLGRDAPALTPAAVTELKTYPWPGNIRELRNAIERAVVLSEGRWIEPSHLPFEKFRTLARPKRPVALPVVEPIPISEPPATMSRIALQEEVASLQKRRVLDALAAAGGNQSAAARFLGMSRGALLGRLRAWGIGAR